MTDEQIARLLELQKLCEEGILNKDDLAKEKAKILGVTTQVSEQQVSETQSVVNTENSVPITLKVKLPKDVNLNRNEQKNTETKNQTYVAESPITKQEPQPKQKEIVAF